MFITIVWFSEQRHLRYSSETPTFYQIYLTMTNTSDVTGGKPIAVWSQFISGVSAINPLIAFYDIHEETGAILLFCPGHHTRRDVYVIIIHYIIILCDDTDTSYLFIRNSNLLFYTSKCKLNVSSTNLCMVYSWKKCPYGTLRRYFVFIVD
jgi:hypothetical protein